MTDHAGGGQLRLSPDPRGEGQVLWLAQQRAKRKGQVATHVVCDEAAETRSRIWMYEPRGTSPVVVALPLSGTGNLLTMARIVWEERLLRGTRSFHWYDLWPPRYGEGDTLFLHARIAVEPDGRLCAANWKKVPRAAVEDVVGMALDPSVRFPRPPARKGA